MKADQEALIPVPFTASGGSESNDFTDASAAILRASAEVTNPVHAQETEDTLGDSIRLRAVSNDDYVESIDTPETPSTYQADNDVDDGWDTMATSTESLQTFIKALSGFKSKHETELRTCLEESILPDLLKEQAEKAEALERLAKAQVRTHAHHFVLHLIAASI